MEPQIEEIWMGDNCLAFDGRVVELFGFAEVFRLHLREFGSEVEGPDKRGSYRLRIGRVMEAS